MYDIEIYSDKKGNSEIKEYIKELKLKNDKNSKIKYSKIIACIRTLEIYGNSIGKKYIKHLRGEIWELRPLRDRILFASLNNKFILLSVFMKDTKKTPKREIEKAKRL